VNLLSLSSHVSIKGDRPRQIGLAGATLLHVLLVALLWPYRVGVLDEDVPIEVEIVAMDASVGDSQVATATPLGSSLSPKHHDSPLPKREAPPSPSPEPTVENVKKTITPDDFKPTEPVQFEGAAKPHATPMFKPDIIAKTQEHTAKPLPSATFEQSPHATAAVAPEQESIPYTQSVVASAPVITPSAQFDKPLSTASPSATTSLPSTAPETAAVFLGAANQSVSVGKSANSVNSPHTDSGPIYDEPFLNNPAPEYPANARARGMQGTAYVYVQVGVDGKPNNVEIWDTSRDRELDEAALRAVRQWRFIPATLNGVAMSTSIIIPIEFRLK
jgi:periplasmic protein TonB